MTVIGARGPGHGPAGTSDGGPAAGPAAFPTDALDALFRPASIAVVGASQDPDRIGGRPVRYLLEAGFPGEIHGVNPKYDTVQGVPCVPEISRLPHGIDLYVLAVPARAVPSALEEVGRAGGRAAIVFGGGFAEAGSEGRRLQQELVATAARHRLPVVGPNCLGVCSFPHRTFATLSTSMETALHTPPGRVALVSQSGGFATNLATETVPYGARFSHLVTTGNEAVVQFGDYLRHLAADPGTDAVVGYVEGVGDGARLTAGLAAMRDAGKPVSLMHVGRSARGAAAVGAHTALMSDSTAAVDAALRRYGVRRLDTFRDMMAAVLGHSVPRADRGLAVATISGGTAVYIVDACASLGIDLAVLHEDTVAALREIVPPYGSVRNPVDLTAQVVNDFSSLRRSMQVLTDDPSTGNVLLFLGGHEAEAERIIGALRELRATGEGRVWLSWLGVSERARAAAREAGVRTYADPVDCLHVLAAARAPAVARDLAATADRATGRTATAAGDAAPKPATAPTGSAGAAAPAKPDEPAESVEFVATADGGRALDEWQGMRLLEAAGVAVPRRWSVEGEADLERVARQATFPCVAKLLRPHLAHRSAQGAVRTGLSSPHDLHDAWRELRKRHGARRVLVAEQATARAELIVGVLRDRAFGLRAVLGSGGVRANDLDDHTTLVPPFTPTYVRTELARLRIWTELAATPLGQQGVATGVTAVLDALDGIMRRHPALTEFETNPLLVTDDGLLAVDALGSAQGEE